MNTVLLIVGGAALVFAFWRLFPRRGNEAGPHNNWQNEDFAAREADGTWAEGSTQTTPVASRPPSDIFPGTGT